MLRVLLHLFSRLEDKRGRWILQLREGCGLRRSDTCLAWHWRRESNREQSQSESHVLGLAEQLLSTAQEIARVLADFREFNHNVSS